jgi:hypothetical protein
MDDSAAQRAPAQQPHGEATQPTAVKEADNTSERALAVLDGVAAAILAAYRTRLPT